MAFSSRGLSEAQIQAQADASITKVATNTTNKLTDARALNLDHLDADISAVSPKMPLFIWSLVPPDTTITIAGTWAINADNGFVLNSRLTNTTGAINDEIGIGTVLIPEDGNYTFYLTSATGNSLGNVHVLLDGVDKGTIDCYSAGSVYEVKQSVAMGALTKGIYCITLKISDKNASSSDYVARLTSMAIAKT